MLPEIVIEQPWESFARTPVAWDPTIGQPVGTAQSVLSPMTKGRRLVASDAVTPTIGVSYVQRPS